MLNIIQPHIHTRMKITLLFRYTIVNLTTYVILLQVHDVGEIN